MVHFTIPLLLDFTLCSLWGGAVMNLGTQKHRDKYYAGIDNLDYLGCFAMTELHHGEYDDNNVSFLLIVLPLIGFYSL